MRHGNIQFSLTQPGNVTLELYNTLGQLVETLVDGLKPAGVHELYLDTQGLPLGTYFLVLETPLVRKSQSVIVIR